MNTIKQIHRYQYNLKDLLGKGSFGTVYKARNYLTGDYVALKMIDRKLFAREEQKQQIEQEIAIMKKFQHQNIVSLIDVFESAHNKYIVTELCNGPDLREYLKNKGPIKEEEATKILKDLVNGLKEIVSKGIIHRDLKPANIIQHDNTFKITDFGFSRQFSAQELMQSLVGTPLYMAPQILIKQSYTNKCDVWSLGLIYFEILTGNTPWIAYTIDELIMQLQITPLKFPEGVEISNMSKNFIRGCLQIDESKRFTWEQVFNHPLISPPKLEMLFNENHAKKMILEKKNKGTLRMRRTQSQLDNLPCISQLEVDITVVNRILTNKNHTERSKFQEKIKTIVGGQIQNQPSQTLKKGSKENLKRIFKQIQTPKPSEVKC